MRKFWESYWKKLRNGVKILIKYRILNTKYFFTRVQIKKNKMSLKKQFSKSKPVCKVTFNLPKEAVNGGKSVVVLGDFNNWEPKKGLKMKSGKSGFTASTELATGKEYEFRYLIDKINWTNDWDADAYRPSPYYGIDNSVVFIANAPVAKKVTKKKAAPKKETKKKVSLKAATKKSAPKRQALKKTSQTI